MSRTVQAKFKTVRNLWYYDKLQIYVLMCILVRYKRKERNGEKEIFLRIDIYGSLLQK